MACSSIVQNVALSLPPPAVVNKAKSVVKLRVNTIANKASVIAARPPRFYTALSHAISARPAAVFAAAGTPNATPAIAETFSGISATKADVAILNSGATHHL